MRRFLPYSLLFLAGCSAPEWDYVRTKDIKFEGKVYPMKLSSKFFEGTLSFRLQTDSGEGIDRDGDGFVDDCVGGSKDLYNKAFLDFFIRPSGNINDEFSIGR